MAKEISEEVRAEIIALRDGAISGFQKHLMEFIELERGYINVLSNAQRKSLIRRQKSALTPNLIKPKVDLLVRDVMKSFFSSDELAEITEYEGSNENDKKTTVALVKELKDFSRDRNLYSKCKPVVRDSLVYGTAISKVYWSSRENTVKIEQPKLDSIYLDPYAPSIHDIRFLVHRVNSMTIADLEAQYRVHIDWERYVNDSLIGNKQYNQSYDINKYQRIEFHEVYRKKGNKWYVTTILNDDTILRLDKYLKDGLPFIPSVLDPQFVMLSEPVMPTRAYGGAFIAPLLSLQKEHTVKRNQQIDATDIQLNQRFITTKNSGLREDDLASNRKKIVVDDIANIRELPIPRLNDSIFDTNKVEAEAEQISGVTKFSQGIIAGREKTAREVRAIENQGSSVVDDLNRAFNENFFRPLIRRIVMLIYKYKSSVNFVGIDRSRGLRHKIIINVGVGSTNKLIASENNDVAINAVMQSMQAFLQINDIERAKKYALMLDELNMEKMKLLGQDTIIEKVKKAEEEAEGEKENAEIQ